jgi:hypothetical protein
MWNFNLTVQSVFANSAGSAQAALSGFGFRVIAAGAGLNTIISILSDAATSGKLAHVFINSAGQITAAQLA